MGELRQRGHEVFAFAPDFDASSKAELQAIGVEPIDCPMTRAGMNPVQEFATILWIWRALRGIRPDVSLAIFLKPVAYATIAAWLAGVPNRYGLVAGLGFVFGARERASLRLRLLRHTTVAVLRFATARISRLAFQNPDDLNEALKIRLIARDKANLVGATGVDLDKFGSSQPSTRIVTFILVARLLREKGIHEFVEAARRVGQTYPDAKFMILGGLDNNPSAITRSEIEHWTDEGVVEWPGHVDVKPYLEASSVFVLPSYYREGVPRSTQEAMAVGRPVITADTPGCRETVIDGVNGFLVPPRDHEALASAMQRFLDNPELIVEMGEESRKLAERKFNIRVQNDKLISMLEL